MEYWENTMKYVMENPRLRLRDIDIREETIKLPIQRRTFEQPRNFSRSNWETRHISAVGESTHNFRNNRNGRYQNPPPYNSMYSQNSQNPHNFAQSSQSPNFNRGLQNPRFKSTNGHNNNNNNYNNNGVQVRCYNCNEVGHIRKNCKKVIVCNICRRIGHRATECNRRNFIRAGPPQNLK